VKVLVTAFGPFGELTVNPSQLILQELPQYLKGDADIQLVTALLPVDFCLSGTAIQSLIAHHSPELVLSLGVAARRERITLERIALNLDDASTPDNAGRCRDGAPILADGALAYQSNLPLTDLRDELNRRGVPCAISNHAGTFLCNHVFYRAAYQLHRDNLGGRFGFVHVPLLADGDDGDDAPLTLSQAVDGIGHILRYLCHGTKENAHDG
jgi:pyroglutamyl-peptidase